MTQGFLGRRVVTISGGSGGSTMLLGLRDYPIDITAISGVCDNGGSTGELRDMFGSLPQGDVVRLIVALSRDEHLRALFMHRFSSNGSALANHSLGNLLLLAAEQRWNRLEGIKIISKILNIQGTVLPVSVNDVHLIADLSDGTPVHGETAIDRRDVSDERELVRARLDSPAFICGEAAEALLQADLIIISPGDLYTSIVQILLVTGMAEAIERSSAKLVYVANLMTKWSETRNYTVERILETLLQYGIGRKWFDAVIVNSRPVPDDLLARYWKEEKSELVRIADRNRIAELAVRVIEKDVLHVPSLSDPKKPLIRHDPFKLAPAILELGEDDALDR